MTNYVDGKVVVVTGAGSGFGRLLVRKCAALGAKVVGADVDEEAARITVDDAKAAGGTAEAFRVDVTDKAQVDALAAFALERFGRIDVMVNNAGTMPLAFYADHARAWEAWDRCIDVNIKGVLHGIIAVHDAMARQGAGHVVNVSSIYGNFPNAGAAVYTASKAAVNILSEALRMESQGRIKVTIVRPTGVPATNLGGTVVNAEAVVGLVGHNVARFGEHMSQYANGTMPAEMADPDSPRYWAIDPDQLTDQVMYAINQPWGVSIAEITVRATGEDYLL